MSKIIPLSDDSFSEFITDNSVISIIYFTANWCKHCKKHLKVLEEIVSENSQELQIGEIDIDQNKKLKKEFDIRGLPTTIFIYDEKIFSREVGLRKKDEVNDIINSIYDELK